MASKNQNPYRDGVAYAKIFDDIRKANGVVTRQALIEKGHNIFDITVVLSPRAEGSSTRGGDCRGNLSAAGHIYYMEKLLKVKGEPQRFRLRWRKTELEKNVRMVKKNIVSQKKTKKEKVVAVETPVVNAVPDGVVA